MKNKISQTGFAPTINSYTNFGEGLGIYGNNTTNDPFNLKYLVENVIIIETQTFPENLFATVEHSIIKNSIVSRKNPAILKHL